MGRPAEKHSDLPERPQAPPADAEARARQALRGPANVMETVGGLYFILCTLALLGSGLSERQWQAAHKDEELAYLLGAWTVAWILPCVGLGWSAALIAGARQMRQLRKYHYAVASAMLAMLPVSLCFWVGLPAGILALVRLRRPEVRAAFH